MEQRMSLVTLGVNDLARARRFYEEGLGWHRDGGADDVAFYQTGGFIMALWGRSQLADDAAVEDKRPGFDGLALAYCARTKKDVDAVLAQAKAAGGRITVPARDTFWGGYSGYFADPDGHLWEIAWNPGWTLTDDGRTLLKHPRES
jgi:catechol 2,3-dioxygenase-like lactoylglutathione lyase family enzyme